IPSNAESDLRLRRNSTTRPLTTATMSSRSRQDGLQEEVAMSNPSRLLLASLSVGCCLAFACRAQAQQRENSPTGDIKPAQTDSPGAHPVTDPPGTTVVPEGRRNADPRRDATGRTRNETVRRTDRRENSTDREGNLDRHLADCLLQKNKGEVELGKYAAEHA